MNNKKFNVRVYGIVIDPERRLLVSDELIREMRFTKFPGGGLEWGEGTRECLQREFMEELNQPVEVLDHLYTTDYFQQSAFRDEDQLLSIYYRVNLVGEPRFTASEIPFDFQSGIEAQQMARWLPIDTLKERDFTWPVDKVVARMVRERF